MSSKPYSAASPQPGGDPVSDPAEVSESARAAADAIRHLCRETLARPSMTPAEVDIVLGHLTAAVAGLPQAAKQLGDILEHARRHQELEMDTLTETLDPDLAVETARLHLDALHEPALDLLRHFDAARLETAHISTSATPRVLNVECPSTTPPARPVRRPEDRRPPTVGGGTGAGVPR